MINRKIKLRWRHQVRRGRRQVEDISLQAEEHLERHFFKRLERFMAVRRFISAWVLFIMLLATGVIFQTRLLGDYYLELQAVAGGSYSEGILGSFTNASPLYAANEVDSSVARLIFSGLFKYDQKNQLVGDLAQNYSVDERGLRYSVLLRSGLKWHDGRNLTAQDVVFTYSIIQNPDAKSPLFTSWQKIAVEAIDDRTVVFTLPNSLSAFPYSLTNGIVPKHLLDGIPIAQLRSVNFNTASPVGSGPFKWEAIEVQGDTTEEREVRIGLVPNEFYYGGKPKLNRFIIRAFRNENTLLESFKNQELNGVVGLSSLPEELEKNTAVYSYNIPLAGGVFVFLKTSQPILQDVQVRRALALAADQNQLISGLGFPVIALHGPLLQQQVGYDKALPQLSYNVQEAARILDGVGWIIDPLTGVRTKAGQELTLNLYSYDNSEYSYVTQILQNQWRLVGINAQVILQSASEIQTTIASHGYDALVYGIALGVDPDVFAFWHSTQADFRSANKLNFSEYKSAVADKALEAGRTRADPAVRAAKYRPFLEAWRTDVPAIALYQPRFLYLTHQRLFGFEVDTLTGSIDRYANVQNWMIRQDKTIK